uniref:Uncharacterized protein n=1 Tax=Vespula pensylvanica TaxID=30213 RepID=A0A834N7Z3_VESPE|nr:hypothetical protein H0235_016247 [Vespula pensylvanica]
MDISEDCWEHVGLLQEVSPSEPAPPPLQPDFLIQQQENVSFRFDLTQTLSEYEDGDIFIVKSSVVIALTLFTRTSAT